jgi:hypothetical protein
VLVNRSTLYILHLKSLGLLWWLLGVGWHRLRKLRWLERVDESIPPKVGVMRSWDGMSY